MASDFINEKFSTRAKSALKSAQKISQELKAPYIGTEHLLYGIVVELSSFASEVMLKHRISEQAMRLELARINTASGVVATWQPKISANLKAVLERSAILASRYQYQFIGTEHFLYAIVDSPNNKAQTVLTKLNIDPAEIRKNMFSIFENIAKFPESLDFRETPAKLAEDPMAAG